MALFWNFSPQSGAPKDPSKGRLASECRNDYILGIAIAVPRNSKKIEPYQFKKIEFQLRQTERIPDQLSLPDSPGHTKTVTSGFVRRLYLFLFPLI